MKNLKGFQELILENIPTGVITTDAHGVITSMNAAAEHITGYKREEFIGRRWTTVHPFPPETKSLLERTYYTGEPHLFCDLPMVRKDGREVAIEIKTALLRDGRGRKMGVVAIFSDITERKQVQQRLQELEFLSRIGQLAVGIAHEIRNPLAGISSLIQVLREGVRGDEQMEPLIEQVLWEVKRLNHVVAQLLDFAHPDRIHPHPCNLREVVEGAMLLVRRQLESKGIQAEVQCELRDPTILVDSGKIRGILLNLFLNAMRAMPEGGRLRVILSPFTGKAAEDVLFWATPPPSEGVRVEVEDTGRGIDPSLLSSIFRPFFTTHPQGTGMGLFICKRVVEAHGGGLGVRSAPSRGTAFVIVLPR